MKIEREYNEIEYIEITNYTLVYIGVYYIEFTFNNKEYNMPVYITPEMIVKMLKIEGYLHKPAPESFCWERQFKKAPLQLQVRKNDDKLFFQNTDFIDHELHIKFIAFAKLSKSKYGKDK